MVWVLPESVPASSPNQLQLITMSHALKISTSVFLVDHPKNIIDHTNFLHWSPTFFIWSTQLMLSLQSPKNIITQNLLRHITQIYLHILCQSIELALKIFILNRTCTKISSLLIIPNSYSHFKWTISSFIYMLPSHLLVHFRADAYLYNEINIFVSFSLYFVMANLQSFISGIAL